MANLFTLMVTYTKESGGMTKLMERATISMLMGLITLVSGKMTSNMGSESKYGLMGPYMKACIVKERKTGKES